MRLVLDTCALITLAMGGRMGAAAQGAIGRAGRAGTAYVSAITALEIGQQCAVGRLRFMDGSSARTWFERAVSKFRLRQVPVTASIALAAYELPDPFQKDPADRIIVATARMLRAPVVTIDQPILAYGRREQVDVIDY
jgi:PIN domain nuclease of toxin-antitoxin system